MGLIFNGNGDVIKAVDGSLTVEGLDIGGSTNIEAGIGTFSGNLNVGGVLTYEDVKNVDSVGVITARAGIKDQTLTAGRVVYVDSDKTLTDSGNLTFDSSELTLTSRHLLLDTDGYRIKLGTANDFQLWHTGSANKIQSFVGDIEYISPTGSGHSFQVNSVEKLRIESSGRVGINTTSAKVNGLHIFDKHLAVTEGYPLTWLQPNSSTSRGRMTCDSGGHYLFQFGSGNDEKIRFKSNGSVGIGTNNPDVKLVVSNGGTSSSASGGTLARIVGSGVARLDIVGGNSNHSILEFSRANLTAAGQITYYHSDNSLSFTLNGAQQKLRIESNGDVEWNNVGTPTPGEGNNTVGMGFEPRNGTIFLSRGSNALIISNRNNDGRHIHFNQGGTGKFAIGLQNSGADLAFFSGSGNSPTERLRITSNGKVGIGTISPSGSLGVWDASGSDPTMSLHHSNADVEGEIIRVARTDLNTIRYHSINAMHAGSATNNYINFALHNGGSGDGYTEQTEVLRIVGNGRVGIGTVNPSNQLHIADYSADVDVTLQATASGKDARLNLYGNSTGVCQIRLGDETDANIGRITYYHAASGTNEANSLEFITGDVSRVRVASTGLVLPQTTNIIRTDTSDGSDNKRIILAAGGQNSQVRGAQIAMYGNEYSSHEGRLQLLAGNSGNTNGVIQMYAGGSERLRITSGGFVQIGDAANAAEAPLHVTAENSNGINAIFGAKDFVTTASYNYDDANIALQGRDAGDNDTGAGIQFTVRTTANNNWLHGAITMDQSGAYIFKNGGAGVTVGTERLKITSGGQIHISQSTPQVQFIDSDGTNQLTQILQSGSAFYIDLRDNTSDGQLIIRGKGGGTATERVRINTDGDISIGTNGDVHGVSKLTIKPANRTTAFSASDGDTWHDVVLLQAGSATNNAVGIAFELKNDGSYHKNAGTGIACVKNGTNSDYGSDLVFITRGQSVVAEERLRLNQSGTLLGDTTAVNAVKMQLSNDDHGNNVFNHRGNRTLHSNGTGWDGNVSNDGMDPILVCSVADRAGNGDIGDALGLLLHSESQDDNDYGPLLAWSSRSNSGNYNSIYGAIVGRRTGQGTDTNWNAGELHFFTAPAGSGAYMNSTPDMKIDSEGHVTKPRNPAFSVRHSVNQSVSSSGWTQKTFNTEIFDIGGNFSSNAFTAPVDGIYSFGWNQRFDSGNGNYFRVVLRVNDSSGSQYQHGHSIYRDDDGFHYVTLNLTSLLQLDAGDTVKAYAFSNTDTSYILQNESIFWGYLVS